MHLGACCRLLPHWESVGIAQPSVVLAQEETLPEVTEDRAALKLPQQEQAVRFPFVTCNFVSMGIKRAWFPTFAPHTGFKRGLTDFPHWEISEGSFSVASLMCSKAWACTLGGQTQRSAPLSPRNFQVCNYLWDLYAYIIFAQSNPDYARLFKLKKKKSMCICFSCTAESRSCYFSV